MVFFHVRLFSVPAIKPAGPQFAFERLISKRKTLPHKSSEELSNGAGSFGANEVLIKWVSMETNMLATKDTQSGVLETGKANCGAQR